MKIKDALELLEAVATKWPLRNPFKMVQGTMAREIRMRRLGAIVQKFKKERHGGDEKQFNKAGKLINRLGMHLVTPTNFKKVVKESKLHKPIPDHPYHYASDAELHYVVKDAGEAAKNLRDHPPAKHKVSQWEDQVNDASTVLGYRKRGGERSMKKNVKECLVFEGVEVVNDVLTENRMSGYISDDGKTLQDGQGKHLGHVQVISRKKLKPGDRGSWISNEIQHIRVHAPDGRVFHGRTYGSGMSANVRQFASQSRRQKDRPANEAVSRVNELLSLLDEGSGGLQKALRSKNPARMNRQVSRQNWKSDEQNAIAYRARSKEDAHELNKSRLGTKLSVGSHPKPKAIQAPKSGEPFAKWQPTRVVCNNTMVGCKKKSVREAIDELLDEGSMGDKRLSRVAAGKYKKYKALPLETKKDPSSMRDMVQHSRKHTKKIVHKTATSAKYFHNSMVHGKVASG